MAARAIRWMLRPRLLVGAALAASILIPGSAGASPEGWINCIGTQLNSYPYNYVTYGVNTYYWQTGEGNTGNGEDAQTQTNIKYFVWNVEDHPTDVETVVEYDLTYFLTYTFQITILNGYPNNPHPGGYASAYFQTYGQQIPNWPGYFASCIR